MMKYHSVFKTVAGLFINVARDPQAQHLMKRKKKKQTNQDPVYIKLLFSIKICLEGFIDVIFGCGVVGAI